MQQYVFSLSSRMLAVACACLVALCALLFLLGVEIGRMAAAPATVPQAVQILPQQMQQQMPQIPQAPQTLQPAAPAGAATPASPPAYPNP